MSLVEPSEYSLERWQFSKAQQAAFQHGLQATNMTLKSSQTVQGEQSKNYATRSTVPNSNSPIKLEFLVHIKNSLSKEKMGTNDHHDIMH